MFKRGEDYEKNDHVLGNEVAVRKKISDFWFVNDIDNYCYGGQNDHFLVAKVSSRKMARLENARFVEIKLQRCDACACGHFYLKNPSIHTQCWLAGK